MTKQPTTIRQTENEKAAAQTHTVNARDGAERLGRNPMLSWLGMLEESVSIPGFIFRAHSCFPEYRFDNQLLALLQCIKRGIQPGPLSSLRKWKELGRRVKKGENALGLYVPLVGEHANTSRKGDGASHFEHIVFPEFILRYGWYVLGQTEGEDYQARPVRVWSEHRALTTLNIQRIPFERTGGNAQGYARPGRRIAIRPSAALQFAVLFHEMAHCILHSEATRVNGTLTMPRMVMEVEAEFVALLCCEALRLPGKNSSRAYIRSWGKRDPISELSARRILFASDQILRAGLALNTMHGTHSFQPVS